MGSGSVLAGFMCEADFTGEQAVPFDPDPGSLSVTFAEYVYTPNPMMWPSQAISRCYNGSSVHRRRTI